LRFFGVFSSADASSLIFDLLVFLSFKVFAICSPATRQLVDCNLK
jgi:hypothetical protein